MPQKKKVVRKTQKPRRVAKTSRVSRSVVTKKKIKPRKQIKQIRKDYQNRFSRVRWTDSYSSFLLGVVVVIVAILFGITVIRQQSHTTIKQTTSLSTGPTATLQPSPTAGVVVVQNGKSYYVVKQNDSLWNIALVAYNNGYKWVDIAKANNLTNPDIIFTGDKLLLPNAPQSSELGQLMDRNKPTPTVIPNVITGNSYIVKKGDDLWHIALRKYSDGYQWVKIAQANHLANPDLIFSGNVLTLPQ